MLLWFNVTAIERQDHQVRTRLEFEVTDSTWVPLRLPVEATTIFQGRRRDVSRLFLEVPRISVVIDSVPGPEMQVLLRPDMVIYDRTLRVGATDVRPSSVELRFERRVTKEVAVEANIETTVAPGYVIVGDPIIDPPTVTVRGTESAVEAVQSILTERLSLRNVARSETHRLILQPPAESASLSMAPRSVQITIEVDSLLERSLSVPLRATGRAADQVRLGTNSVSIRLRGPARVVRSLSPSSLSAVVRVDAVPERPVNLTVQIGLPEGADAEVTRAARVLVSPLTVGEPEESPGEPPPQEANGQAEEEEGPQEEPPGEQGR